MTVFLFGCEHCGRRDHPAQLCPSLPPDVAKRLEGDGASALLDCEWGDRVTVWTPLAHDDHVVYLGVHDADEQQSATVVLSLDEAARVGAELSLAACLKRGQRAG